MHLERVQLNTFKTRVRSIPSRTWSGRHACADLCARRGGLAGVAYGVVARIGFEGEDGLAGFGADDPRLHRAGAAGRGLPDRRARLRRGGGCRSAVRSPCVTAVACLVFVLAVGLEGIICVVLIAPVFLFFSAIGGLMGRGLRTLRPQPADVRVRRRDRAPAALRSRAAGRPASPPRRAPHGGHPRRHPRGRGDGVGQRRAPDRHPPRGEPDAAGAPHRLSPPRLGHAVARGRWAAAATPSSSAG